MTSLPVLFQPLSDTDQIFAQSRSTCDLQHSRSPAPCGGRFGQLFPTYDEAYIDILIHSNGYGNCTIVGNDAYSCRAFGTLGRQSCPAEDARSSELC